MSGGAGRPLAGLLRERVTLWRPGGRDAFGGASGDMVAIAAVWAGCVSDGGAKWRVAMRPCAVAAGDVLERVSMRLAVTEVIADPRLPDRITVRAEVMS